MNDSTGYLGRYVTKKTIDQSTELHTDLATKKDDTDWSVFPKC